MVQLALTLDPYEILGVTADASLEQIREAYRDKARKYHPDHQGDPWAFRIVNKSYEVLSAARVAARASEEFTRRPEPARPASPPPRAPKADARTAEWIRAGVVDPAVDPARLVDVEVLILRFALEDALDYLFKSPESRNLSCCLNVSWPSRKLGRAPRESHESGVVVPQIERLFEILSKKTRAVGSRSRAEEGSFEGWLSYPTAERAREAFELLHRLLKKDGLGVNQWSREMILDRGQP